MKLMKVMRPKDLSKEAGNRGIVGREVTVQALGLPLSKEQKFLVSFIDYCG